MINKNKESLSNKAKKTNSFRGNIEYSVYRESGNSIPRIIILRNKKSVQVKGCIVCKYRLSGLVDECPHELVEITDVSGNLVTSYDGDCYFVPDYSLMNKELNKKAL